MAVFTAMLIVLATGLVLALILLRSPRRSAQRSSHSYATSGDAPIYFYDGGSSSDDCNSGDTGCGDSGGGDGGSGGDGGGGGGGGD